MRRHLIAILAAIAIAASAAALYVIRSRTVHGSAPPEALSRLAAVSKPRSLPAVAFTDARGGRVSLAVFRGRTVLLNLWATWCAPCVRELPALAHLQRALPNLTIVAVNEGRETAPATASFLKAHGAQALRVYLDADHAFLAALGVEGLPLSVLVDASGVERAQASGPAEWDDPDAIAWLRDVAARGGYAQ